jgi:hypothetical protein
LFWWSALSTSTTSALLEAGILDRHLIATTELGPPMSA